VDKVLSTAKKPKRKLRLSDLMEFTAAVINPNLNIMNNYFVRFFFFIDPVFFSDGFQAYRNHGLWVLGIRSWHPSWNRLGACSLCGDWSDLEMEGTRVPMLSLFLCIFNA
jgi:hypothetical protein